MSKPVTQVTFARCTSCNRLNLCGQRCPCTPIPPRECDCTYEGNRQIIGPGCNEAIREAWAATVRHQSIPWGPTRPLAR